MSQIDQFLDALKKALKRKNIVYRDLAHKLNLSESSVKRILSSKSLTLDRLEEICRVSDIQFSEVCSSANFNHNEDEEFYTGEQEEALARNPRLFHYYLLLEEGMSVLKIQKEFEIGEAEVQKYLLQLDRLKLIELHAKNRVRMPNKGIKRFRKEGAMGRLLFEQTRSSYLQSQFKNQNEQVRFQMVNVAPGSVAKIKVKIEKILADIREDVSFEDPEGPGVESYGILMAIRPWRYTSMDSIKRKTKK